MKTDSVCGLVLAAGLSSRTPTFNKLTYKIGGKPMMWYAVHYLHTADWNDTLHPSGADTSVAASFSLQPTVYGGELGR